MTPGIKGFDPNKMQMMQAMKTMPKSASAGMAHPSYGTQHTQQANPFHQAHFAGGALGAHKVGGMNHHATSQTMGVSAPLRANQPHNLGNANLLNPAAALGLGKKLNIIA